MTDQRFFRSIVGVRGAVPVGVLVILGLGASSTPSPESSLEQGRDLYRIYCRSCHGEQARGDGPTAGALKVKPTDLTRLSRRNGGEFPTADVRDAIDGRRRLPAHGRSEMPIWGLAYQQFDTDIDQEAQIKARIRSLVLFLESIQSESRP